MGLVSLVPFTITALVTRFGWGPSRYWLPLLVGSLGTLLLPFLVAIWLNHEMWGYFVYRPAVDGRIVSARFETATRVETAVDSLGRLQLVGGPLGDVQKYISVHPQEGDYYVLEGRVLRDLKARRALPAEIPEIDPGQLKSLYELLESTGRLEDGDPGYTRAKQVRGVVVEAWGQDGRPLLFVGVAGGEVSNDHYP